MATITNERDIILQATDPRLLVVDTNYLTIIPSTNSFSTSSGGIVPTNIDIKYFFSGILTGTVTWDISPTTSYTTIPGGIRIAGSAVPVGTSITVTATVNFLGNDYTSSTIITHAANSASVITLEQTAANINKTSSLPITYVPTTVVFSAQVSDGIAAPTPYLGRFVVESTADGISYSALYTSASNESSYTYTPNNFHRGVRVKLYKAGGTTVLLGEKSVSISQNGGQGSAGTIIYVTPSTYVLAKNQNNGFSPSSVTFKAYSKSGALTPSLIASRFRIYENGSGTPSYSSASDESSTTYTPTSGCTIIKCEVYEAGGFTSLMDTQEVITSAAGSNAISAILTNESHTFPASTTGAVSSYTGSGTELYIYEGGTPIPYNEAGYNSGDPNTWKVTTVGTNITVGSKTDGGNYASFANASSVSAGTDTSTIEFTIVGRTSIGLAFTATKKQTFSKSKQGVEGPPGPSDTTNLLKLNAANILTGTVEPSNTGALKIGTITWNSTTGALTGGTGLAMTEWGLIGANSGNPTFTIQTSTGAATFLGDIIGGANIDITGRAKFIGDSVSNNGRHGAIIANDGGSQQYGVIGYATSIFQSSGILGDAGTFSNARGVSGFATTGVGVYCSASSGIALQVDGRMGISNTTLVSNLNADMVDGKHATNLCSLVVPNIGSCNVAGNGFNLVCTVANVRTNGNGSNGITIESFSDKRCKRDFGEETLGLDFINKLHPITFYSIYGESVKYHGFLGQDLAEIFGGVTPDDSLCRYLSDGMISSDYVSLIGPMVKSIQQLSTDLNSSNSKIDLLIKEVKRLTKLTKLTSSK